MNFVAGVVLFVLAVIDFKKKWIPVGPVLALGGVLLVFRLFEGVTISNLVYGLVPGVILLLVAWITKEKIGVGDGLLFLSLGCGYGIESMMLLLAAAFGAAAVISMVLLVFGRANRKTELPFLPFLFVGWLVSVLA